MIPPPSAWGVLGNATPIHEFVEDVADVSMCVCGLPAYPDLHHAVTHVADEVEDAEGYVTWNGRSPNAMNSADREP